MKLSANQQTTLLTLVALFKNEPIEISYVKLANAIIDETGILLCDRQLPAILRKLEKHDLIEIHQAANCANKYVVTTDGFRACQAILSEQ